MGKVNKVISYQNLTPELLELLHKKYPDGYQNHVIKVTTPKNDFFYGVTLDTPDVSYLVKVPVKIDTASPEDIEDKDFGDDDSLSPDENFGGDGDEDVENVADEES
jgi:hypothetical protein